MGWCSVKKRLRFVSHLHHPKFPGISMPKDFSQCWPNWMTILSGSLLCSFIWMQDRFAQKSWDQSNDVPVFTTDLWLPLFDYFMARTPYKVTHYSNQCSNSRLCLVQLLDLGSTQAVSTTSCVSLLRWPATLSCPVPCLAVLACAILRKPTLSLWQTCDVWNTSLRNASLHKLAASLCKLAVC